MKGSSEVRFERLDGLSTAISRFAKLYIGTSLISLISGCLGWFVFSNFEGPEETASGIEMMTAFLLIASSVLNFVCMIVLAISLWKFMVRANKNLRRSSVEGLEYTPAWCVGWWFVPVASLFKPYSAMAELYRASSAPREADWKSTLLPPFFETWWALWIIGGILTRLSDKFGPSTEMLLLAMVACGMMIFAATNLQKVVSSIVAQQNQKLSDLTAPEVSVVNSSVS